MRIRHFAAICLGLALALSGPQVAAQSEAEPTEPDAPSGELPALGVSFWNSDESDGSTDMNATVLAISGHRFISGIAALEVSGRASEPSEDGVPLAGAEPFWDGTRTGTAPMSGSARWTGYLIGSDVSETASRGQRVAGRAELTIGDFAVPRIDVAFTELVELVTANPRDDIRWSGIEIDGGAFGNDTEGNWIQGAFFGPHHEEVGGVFLADQLHGAFGATRSPERKGVTTEPPNLLEADQLSGTIGWWLISNANIAALFSTTTKLTLSALATVAASFGSEPAEPCTSGASCMTEPGADTLTAPEGSDPVTDGSAPDLSSLEILATRSTKTWRSIFPERGPGLASLTDHLTTTAGPGEVSLARTAGDADLGEELDSGIPSVTVSTNSTTFLTLGYRGGSFRRWAQRRFSGFPAADHMPPFNTATTAFFSEARLAPIEGSGRWVGRMLGEEGWGVGSVGNEIRGDAEVVIDDLAAPVASVQFTNVIDVEAGSSLPDMAWTGMPVANGSFVGGTAGNLVEGAFAGSDIGEVHGFWMRGTRRGVFEGLRDNLRGPSATTSGLSTSGLIRSTTIGVESVLAALVSDLAGAGVEADASGATAANPEMAGDSPANTSPGAADGMAPSVGEVLAAAKSNFFVRNGMVVTRKTAQMEGLGSMLDVNALDGWLDGAFFSVVQFTPSAGEDPVLEDSALTGAGSNSTAVGSTLMNGPYAAAAAARGAIAGTNPMSGSGQWSGAMVGVFTGDGAARGEILWGDARIVIHDFASPFVDVSFTRIGGMASRGTRNNMHWRAIPLSAGKFAATDQAGWIEGQFHGAGHEEVAGVFDGGGILGAFGARLGP